MLGRAGGVRLTSGHGVTVGQAGSGRLAVALVLKRGLRWW